MDKLTADDLMTLEGYARDRPTFRAAVIAHKKQRTLRLGDHLSLLFEDRQTVQYQVQEMLRIERIFEPEGIRDELDAYNPLIPDGHNLKATLLIEYDDPEQRSQELARLRGIEDRIELQIGTSVTIAIADEDIERSNEQKTSAVHFLRFELDERMLQDWNAGAEVRLRCTHPAAALSTVLSPEQRCALAADFA